MSGQSQHLVSKMTERRRRLSEFSIKLLGPCHYQVRIKGAQEERWTSITQRTQMQITVTESALCQTLGKHIITFEQTYLRKLCRRQRRRLLEWEEIPVQSGL